MPLLVGTFDWESDSSSGSESGAAEDLSLKYLLRLAVDLTILGLVFCFLGGDLASANLVDARLFGAGAGAEVVAGAGTAREDRRGIVIS